MNNFQKIINKLEAQLESLEIEDENIILRSEKSIKLIKQALKRIRLKVIQSSFSNKEEEIIFFKNIKPKIFSKLIYHAKLFNIESKRPRSSDKSQVKYFNEQIDKLQNYFNENLEFYHYYRRGDTFLDEHYFLRGKSDIRLFSDSFYFYTDEEFSTSHDCSVATIIAYDLLMIHLKKEIDKLENNSNHISLQYLQKQSKMTWTSQKVSLIELIYAIHSTDVINNGNVDIKEIACIVEQIFKIDLGDYYRAFLEIRMRKKGRTKFLDSLKESLEKRMSEVDN
ncbi:MAG: RteC domain-containing protein [Algibacter sp.]|uniref:RteC domain-containing protein n=1 Tax=Algibacter sp. TaxID=1872428 RepID=UPI0026116943|nr:RteC domain-containing protein [Algibacter sp.]MDG1729426.1 RteC domain-containing protein [Algibacter sp.]